MGSETPRRFEDSQRSTKRSEIWRLSVVVRVVVDGLVSRGGQRASRAEGHRSVVLSVSWARWAMCLPHGELLSCTVILLLQASSFKFRASSSGPQYILGSTYEDFPRFKQFSTALLSTVDTVETLSQPRTHRGNSITPTIPRA